MGFLSKKQKTTDRPLWWMIREAFERDGCVICNLALEAETRFFQWFFIETYYAQPMLADLAEGGFCRLHALRLVSRARPYALSATYRVLLDAYKARLGKSLVATRRELERGGGETGDSLLKILTDRLLRNRYRGGETRGVAPRKNPCPACRSTSDSAAFAIKVLVESLETGNPPEAATMLRGSDGLCCIHLDEALQQAGPLSRAALLEVQLAAVEKLEGDLEEYFRKEDYRFAEEPKGKEQHAWRRAISMIEGYLAGDESVPKKKSGTYCSTGEPPGNQQQDESR